MIVLGIDTSTAATGVAIIREGLLLAERFIYQQLNHAVNLLTMVKGTMEDSQVDFSQLAGIAVCVGPGSFTGTRIGLTAARTLAQVWNLPVAGVSSLEALAFPLTGDKGLVCPVLRARKKEVYAAVFDPAQELKLIKEPAAWVPEELAAQLKILQKPVTFTGDGALIYRDLFTNFLKKKALFTPKEFSFPKGAAVAGLGWRKLLKKKADDLHFLFPLYLRIPEAEVKWIQKQKSLEKK